MKHDLVDEFWLKIYPLTLGSGKRLFVDGTIPAAFKVTVSTVSPQWHHYRELRASRRDQNRKLLSRRRVEPLKAGST
jgi:dihydrofolate reductase